jgi:hypothetical protein
VDRCGQRKPPDHSQRQRLLQLGTRAEAEGQRQQPEQRAERRHQDRPKADASRVRDGVFK